MVGVTGALAVDNEAGPDMDYLIVTETGRLWLCRALVILLVRWADRQGDLICPNFFLSERALTFSERDLYTAHELVQMVPLVGPETYTAMRHANAWTAAFLPNANGAPGRHVEPVLPVRSSNLQAAAEAALRTPPGAWLEQWEMERKLRKFSTSWPDNPEAGFCADWCKGHFGGYGRKTLAAYAERLRMLSA
jgi:hypothetical protein